MNMNNLGEKLVQIQIESSQDVVAARFASRQHTGSFGFSPREGIQISTAISELARNIVQHAKSPGHIVIYKAEENGETGITVQAIDSGIGIEDINAVLQKSNTVMSGGLFGTKRFASEFEIKSRIGFGTTVVFRKWCSS